MGQLGKYLLLDRVAVGGMAEIYRAKTFGVEGFEKIIAIKRILPTLAEDEEFVAMFVEEAKIAGQLTHANIAPIYELGKIGETHFIAMEYVWGKDMLQILNAFRRMGKPVPPAMAAWIGAKMLEALDYAHRKRGADGQPLAIIHRDVSPQNVLVSYDGLVKLIDFGIAKAASRATQTQAGVIKGKFGYMSPEQIMGHNLDHRSDVFAASTCLHEMLTRQRLFKGNSDIEIVDKVRQAVVKPPSATAPHVPREIDAIVLRGLARDPSDRYQTAAEMHEALMRWITQTRPPYGTRDLANWMRTAFATEMAEERAHLDHLQGIAQPGVPVRAGGGADFDDEATVVSSAPSDMVIPDEPFEGLEFEEMSQIVVVEELSLPSRIGRDVAGAPNAFAPLGAPPAISPIGAPPNPVLSPLPSNPNAAVLPPAPVPISPMRDSAPPFEAHTLEPAPPMIADDEGPTMRQFSSSPSGGAGAPAPQYRDTPYGTSQARARNPNPAVPPASNRPSAVVPPRLSVDAFAPTETDTQPNTRREEEEERPRRWPLLILMFLLAAALGAVGTWFFALGGRAYLGI